MQNCNNCLSNPKIKEYKHQMFESNDKFYINNNQNMIIEGVGNMAGNVTMRGTVNAVDYYNKKHEQTTELDIDYTLCKQDNDKTCKLLSTQLSTQTEKVSNLYKDLLKKEIEYNKCNDRNDNCKNIETRNKTSMGIIDIFNKEIPIKETLLLKCNNLKTDIRKTETDIKEKNKEAIL